MFFYVVMDYLSFAIWDAKSLTIDIKPADLTVYSQEKVRTLVVNSSLCTVSTKRWWAWSTLPHPSGLMLSLSMCRSVEWNSDPSASSGENSVLFSTIFSCWLLWAPSRYRDQDLFGADSVSSCSHALRGEKTSKVPLCRF